VTCQQGPDRGGGGNGMYLISKQSHENHFKACRMEENVCSRSPFGALADRASTLRLSGTGRKSPSPSAHDVRSHGRAQQVAWHQEQQASLGPPTHGGQGENGSGLFEGSGGGA
jgi:hypothetical protein